MNSRIAYIEPWLVPVERTDSVPAATGRKLWCNGHVVIFSLALALALVTASECHSITHIPSLLYGLALWGWWACVASALWKIGERVPLMSSLTPMTTVTHVLAASALDVVHLLLLGSVGFSVAGWQTKASALSVWTSAFCINRFGLELLMYGFVFGLTAVIQLQIRAAARGRTISGVATAALCRPPARAADADGTAFPLQYLECHHHPG